MTKRFEIIKFWLIVVKYIFLIRYWWNFNNLLIELLVQCQLIIKQFCKSKSLKMALFFCSKVLQMFYFLSSANAFGIFSFYFFLNDDLPIIDQQFFLIFNHTFINWTTCLEHYVVGCICKTLIMFLSNFYLLYLVTINRVVWILQY